MQRLRDRLVPLLCTVTACLARIANKSTCLVPLPERLEDRVGELQLAPVREPDWLACSSELLAARASAARRGNASLSQNQAAPMTKLEKTNMPPKIIYVLVIQDI